MDSICGPGTQSNEPASRIAHAETERGQA